METPASLNVAIQDVNVKAALEQWQPLSEFLQNHHQVKLTLHIESQSEKLKSMVEEGRIDLLMDTLMPELAVNGSSRLEPAFIAWKAGVKEYEGCLVTRRDQTLSVNELPGHVLGFEDPLSTASFALPFSTLLQDGHAIDRLKLVDLSKRKRQNKLRSEKEALITMPRDPAVIHYVFTGTDETSIHWLKRGYLDVAGMSCKTARKDEGLRILSQSPQVPRAIVSLRRDLESDIKRRLAVAFDSLHEGHPALEKLGKVTRISKMTGEETAALSELTPRLRKILDKVRNDQKLLEEGAQ
jgi:ABC-type phosphate/phosphonate transport system substrate-binding protein